MNRLGLLSIRAMNVCRNSSIENIGHILLLDLERIRSLKNCGRRTTEELENIKIKFAYLTTEKNELEQASTETVAELVDNANESVSEAESDINEQKGVLDLIPPSVYFKFCDWLEWKFSKLSVRAKNIVPSLSNPSDVISAFSEVNSNELLSISNCGKKTSYEIIKYIEDVKIHFESILKNISVEYNSQSPISPQEREVAELAHRFPFLLTKECETIYNFIRKEHITPYLYIVKLFVFRSDNEKIKIFRDFYGINHDFSKSSLSEIALKVDLTRERVRQITNNCLPLPKSLHNSVKQYLAPFINDIIPFDDRIWNNIQRDNMLDETSAQTAYLVCSILDSHCIVQIDEKDQEYLVKRSLLLNVKVKNVLYNLCRYIELKHTMVERIDILNYIKSERRSYHKDVANLCIIYANYIRLKYNLEVENDRYVLILPNSLDIPCAIENILDQKGKPMSFSELMEEFNLLYPAYSFSSASSFKPYIFKNPNILAKGKSGFYVLKSWKNCFTGTLTNYLEYILETCNEPILLDDLVDFAKEEFPNTNKKSIYSLIIGDNSDRFIIYQDDYVGLPTNNDSNINLKERKLVKRFSFETRFESFKEFVAIHKRIPNSSGSDEEQSLARWMNNALRNNIEITAEQSELLNQYLLNNKSLPQNGTELRFKQMCDQIKILVNKTFALPTSREYPSEYAWLRKNLNKYSDFEDNRKTYFEDLLCYLKDFGYYFD